MSKSKKMRKLIKSAKMGNVHAIYTLGLYYETEGDILSAADWILKAADAEYAPAIEWISDYTFDDDSLVQADS